MVFQSLAIRALSPALVLACAAPFPASLPAEEAGETAAPGKAESEKRPSFRLSTSDSTRSSPENRSRAGGKTDGKLPPLPDSGSSGKAEPGDPEKEDLPEGAITLGLVRAQATLPPEVRELAREAAAAVAGQDWKTAREKYLEMVEELPENALAQANLGIAEHQLGNLRAASARLKKSLEINPAIASNWQTLGVIHYESGDLDLAISSVMRAIHEAPSEAGNRVLLSALLRDYGWREAAVTELKRALDLDPELADAHFNLALSYLEDTPPKPELARRHYYAALDLGSEASPELERVFGEQREKGKEGRE